MSDADKKYGVVRCLDTCDENIIWFADKDAAIAFYRDAITYTEALIVKRLAVNIVVSDEDE